MDSEQAIRGAGSVVITDALSRRPSRAPDFQIENQALASIAAMMSSDPGSVLQRLVEAAMQLTRAQSAGISLLEEGGDRGTFRWVATTGAWSPYRGGTMPFEASPCGEVVAQGTVLLMKEPARAFPALLQADPGIGEGLLAPFAIDGVQVGTVWVIKHDADDEFDAEDARLLESLAGFAAAAHQMVLALKTVEAARVTDQAQAAAELGKREEAYRQLVETIEDGFCLLEVLFDADGHPYDYRFIEVNAGFEHQTGLTGVVGRTAREMVPDHPHHWFDTFGRIVRSGRAERFEAAQEALGRFYEVHAAPTGPAGSNQLAVLFRDIHLRRQAAAALHSSEARFRAFVTASADAVYRMSADWSEMRQLEGQTFLADTVEPSGEWLQRYIHPEDQPAVRVAIAEAIRTKSMFELKHRVVRADGSTGWTLSRAVPIMTDTGEIAEWLGSASDVSGTQEAEIRRTHAEHALRDSEERLREFGEASQDVLWIRNAETFQWEYLTPGFEAIYGLDRAAALRGDNMAGWINLIVPEDRDHAVASLARVRQGERQTFEFRIRRPADGAVRWLRDTDFPMRDEAGKVIRIGGVGHDVTELKLVEEALAAAEQRQRALLEGIPQLVWRAVDGGLWTWASPQWTEFTGLAEVDSHDRGWLDTLHPDDREAAELAWSTALDTGGFQVDYRIRHAPAGEYRWFATRASAVRAPNGSIVEWLGTSTDVDELRRLQELQKTLLAELQHRVRNILAVIRSMMRRSSDGLMSITDYVQHLEGRLSALARTQVLLTRAVDAGVDLEDLIRDELLAQATDEDQVSMAGPTVVLSPKAAEVVSLAIHELTTNSIKYGALADPSAGLAIEWAVEEKAGVRWLALSWTEHGVAIALGVPRREGFGTELITQRVPYELKGTGSLEMRPSGVQCRLGFPLRDRASILQTDASHGERGR